MTSPNDIAAEVDSISAVILNARNTLQAEGLIDVTSLQDRVNNLCGHLSKLRDGEGPALKPQILTLIDEFNQLSTLIEARLGTLHDDLERTGSQAQALTAYDQAAHSDKLKS